MKPSARVCFPFFSPVLVLGAMLLLAPAEPVHAQPDTYWLHAGLGIGTPGEGAGSASVNYQFGRSLLSLRGAVNFEVFGDELWDVGLLYGLATPPV